MLNGFKNTMLKFWSVIILLFSCNEDMSIFHSLLASQFTPISLSSKLEFWFDNSDSSTITLVNTDEVSVQSDKTGNFSRITNTDTNGNRPNYSNGEIYFDGVSKALVLQGTLSAAAKAGGEIFVVFRRKHNVVGAINAAVPCFFGAYSNTLARWALLRDHANSTVTGDRSMSISHNNGATTNTIYGNKASISDKITIFNYRISPNTEYIFDFDNRGIIGEHVAAGSNNGKWIDDLSSFNAASFAMFKNAGASSFSEYYELEFVYFNEILTTNERDSVYSYLNTKHKAYTESNNYVGVVLWGQSNGEGQGLDATRPNRLNGVTLYDAKIWTATNTFSTYSSANDMGSDFGLDISLLGCLAEYYKNSKVYMVKLSPTGAPLASEPGRQDWNIANAELYPTLVTRAKELKVALDALGTNTIFTLMIQGERDARDVNGGESAAYQTNLTNILAQLEIDGFIADYHIINKLNDDFINSTGGPPSITIENLTAVQTAQEAVVAANANAFLLDMNNFPMDPADYTHYLGGEYILMGTYIFEHILKPNNIID